MNPSEKKVNGALSLEIFLSFLLFFFNVFFFLSFLPFLPFYNQALPFPSAFFFCEAVHGVQIPLPSHLFLGKGKKESIYLSCWKTWWHFLLICKLFWLILVLIRSKEHMPYTTKLSSCGCKT